jgi:hypothetical protein
VVEELDTRRLTQSMSSRKVDESFIEGATLDSASPGSIEGLRLRSGLTTNLGSSGPGRKWHQLTGPGSSLEPLVEVRPGTTPVLSIIEANRSWTYNKRHSSKLSILRSLTSSKEPLQDLWR